MDYNEITNNYKENNLEKTISNSIEFNEFYKVIHIFRIDTKIQP